MGSVFTTTTLYVRFVCYQICYELGFVKLAGGLLSGNYRLADFEKELEGRFWSHGAGSSMLVQLGGELLFFLMM